MRVLMNVVLLVLVRDVVGVHEVRVGVQCDEGISQPRPLPIGNLGDVAADAISVRHVCLPLDRQCSPPSWRKYLQTRELTTTEAGALTLIHARDQSGSAENSPEKRARK